MVAQPPSAVRWGLHAPQLKELQQEPAEDRGGEGALGVTRRNWNGHIPAAFPPRPEAPREATCAPPSRGGGRKHLPPALPSPPPEVAPRRRSGPQSNLGEPRRKDARALGGGEVIKGKEAAAGGSGRFSCSVAVV